MKVEIPIVQTLKIAREKVHLANVAITSKRAEEVLEAISNLLNDACFDLDETIENMEKLKDWNDLKAGTTEKKAA